MTGVLLRRDLPTLRPLSIVAAARTPSKPSDIEFHHRVTFTGWEGAKEWTFRAGCKVERLTVRSRVAVNTAEAVTDAANAGIGITRLLCYQVSDAVLDRVLKVLLCKFEPAPLPVSLFRGRQTCAAEA